MDEDDPIRHELVIPIVPPRDGQPPEWRIVELQGEVERKDGGSLEDAFDAGQMEELPDVRGARGAAAGGALADAREGGTPTHLPPPPPRRASCGW